MPALRSPHPLLYATRPGALPARFRRERLLIVGCGDVGQRVAAFSAARLRVLALTSSPERVAALRALHITPLVGDLDRPESLCRLAGLATRVVHMAPPPAAGDADPRTRALLAVLRRRSPPQSLVYGSTSGVYGNHDGAWVRETTPLRAASARAIRRVDAEQRVRHFARAVGVVASVLRIPGIYAPDRPGGTPRERLLRAQPVLIASEDVLTNHIHADDLARASVLALWRGRPGRVYNVNDDSQLPMGDYYDAAADGYGLARPPRVSRQQAQAVLPAMTYSFMCESRRMDNTRLKTELRVRLRHPTVLQGLFGDGLSPATVGPL
ncbi:MAG: SDR family oxidoreductase [Rhodoferax sp.]